LVLIPDTSISSSRVARELDRLLADRGKPTDNAYAESFNLRFDSNAWVDIGSLI
jgi:hypothetical protein